MPEKRTIFILPVLLHFHAVADIRRHGAVTHLLRDAALGTSRTEEREMMETNAIEHHQGERSHPVGQVWGPARNEPEGSNTCLTIKRLANDVYSVHVGIDIYMTRQEAQAHIDRLNGYPLIAYIVGDDGRPDRQVLPLFNVPKTWTRAGDHGLSAEFDAVVGPAALNEDAGRDELYARVTLVIDGHASDPRYTSGVIAAHF
jgi:hypothetical protein